MRLDKRERNALKRLKRDKLPSGNYASAGSRILELRAIGSPRVAWGYDGKHNKARKAVRIGT